MGRGRGQVARLLSIALASTKLTCAFPGAERAGLSERLALAFGCHGDLDANLPGLRSVEIGVAGEGLPVAASLLAVAGGLAGAGQATVGPYLFVLVTALDRQGQRGGVPSAGLVDLARGEERFAEAIERLGLTRAIAGLAVQGQRLPEMADGLTAAALPQLGKAQASQHPGLAQPADRSRGPASGTAGGGRRPAGNGLAVARVRRGRPARRLRPIRRRRHGRAPVTAASVRRPADNGPAAGLRLREHAAHGPHRRRRLPPGR